MGVKDEAGTKQLTVKDVTSDEFLSRIPRLSVSAFGLPGGDGD
jgi:hypothetical protein